MQQYTTTSVVHQLCNGCCGIYTATTNHTKLPPFTYSGMCDFLKIFTTAEVNTKVVPEQYVIQNTMQDVSTQRSLSTAEYKVISD